MIDVRHKVKICEHIGCKRRVITGTLYCQMHKRSEDTL
jgi:hypothetical protein